MLRPESGLGFAILSKGNYFPVLVARAGPSLSQKGDCPQNSGTFLSCQPWEFFDVAVTPSQPGRSVSSSVALKPKLAHAGLDCIFRQVNQQLREATLGSRVVAEDCGEGLVAQRLGEALPEGFTRTRVIAESVGVLKLAPAGAGRKGIRMGLDDGSP